MMEVEEIISLLRDRAAEACGDSRTPYSGRKMAVALLLSTGEWIPGVRVETASLSLIIPAIVNAFTTAQAYRRYDIVAGVKSEPLEESDRAFLRGHSIGPFIITGSDSFGATGVTTLPEPIHRLDPFQSFSGDLTPEAGIGLARQASENAYVPASNFRVGCAMRLADGRILTACNIEHHDWSRILCAERNALGTAASYAVQHITDLYVSCPADDGCSPCGACRQVIAELAPDATIWMDGGPDRPPVRTSPDELLPGSFTGKKLLRHA